MQCPLLPSKPILLGKRHQEFILARIMFKAKTHLKDSSCYKNHKIDFYSRERILLLKLSIDFLFFLEVTAGISFSQERHPFSAGVVYIART